KRPAAASTRASACHALHAWACALRALNVSLPPWCPPRPEPRLTPLLRTYLEYRRSHGASRPAPSSVIVTWHRAFCASWPAVAGPCGSSRRSISMPLLNNRLAKSRHAQWWSGVGRSDRLLRFLHLTGRIRRNVLEAVRAPRYQADRPPRALPWSDVRRIL